MNVGDFGGSKVAKLRSAAVYIDPFMKFSDLQISIQIEMVVAPNQHDRFWMSLGSGTLLKMSIISMFG